MDKVLAYCLPRPFSRLCWIFDVKTKAPCPYGYRQIVSIIEPEDSNLWSDTMSDQNPTMGNYEILGLLGQGGMGSVYLAQSPDHEHPVALKVLTSDVVGLNLANLERFKREGEALRLLNHPNIVKMLDVLEQSGRHSLVLEYVEGGSLQQLLKAHTRLPIGASLKIALELADALTRAHHLKIVHRDIKPANILFARDGSIRLTDFGLARMEHAAELTQSGVLLGSLQYISPESINGSKADPKMDIWSFGVVLYEMLTGQRPFEDGSMSRTLNNILSQPAPSLQTARPDIPAPLDTLVAQMLAKDPNERIESVRKVAAELESIVQSLPDDVSLDFPAPIMQSFNEKQPIEPISQIASASMLANSQAETMMTDLQRRSRRQGLTLGLALLVALVLAGLLLASLNLESDVNDNPPEPTFDASPVSVEPVAEGNLMILVAMLEPLGEERAQIDRFVLEDLQARVENGAPLSGLSIRRYPKIIRSAEEATAAAQLNAAEMVVWGNYDDQIIEYSLHLYAHEEALNDLPTDNLQNAGDIRVRLEDVRAQSIAPQVLTSATVWYAYRAMPFEAATTMVAFYDLIDQAIPTAEVFGSTPADNVYRHYVNLYDDPALAVEQLDAALRADPDNPLTYHLRGAAIDRIGATDEALQDTDTSKLLSDEVWAMPYMNSANLYGNQANYEQAIDDLTHAIGLEPEQWLYYALRGGFHLLDGDLDATQADMEAAIERDPNANFPYIIAMNIAIQEGRIDDVQTLLNTILEKFPDPSLGNRIILTAGNQPEQGGYFALTLSAFNNLVLQQYDAALRDVNLALEIEPDSPDLELFKGVVECALGDFEAAEASYTRGLEINDEMTVLYLLRSDVRNRLGNVAGGLEDFAAATQTPSWGNFETLVNDALASGEGLGCESFFTPTTP